ncbi:MAG: hypothetical protein ACREQ4_01090 [Candidatus Binataceae bacterium]
MLRKSKDGSLFFVEGEARGFWLGTEPLAEDSDVPWHAPYGGVFQYDTYRRCWLSMRGFVVAQGEPELVEPDDPRVIDYRAAAFHADGRESARVARGKIARAGKSK